MLETGDTAPDFTVPVAKGSAYDVGEFTLSTESVEDSIVLAFYPAAFTGGCTEEMCYLRDSIESFEQMNAQVYGVSVDLPFTQNAFIDNHGLNFPMLSDTRRDVIRKYDVVLEVEPNLELAERSVFVVSPKRKITYSWVRQDSNPRFSELFKEVQESIDKEQSG